MTTNELPASGELRLVPIDPPGLAISLPVVGGPFDGDKRCRFRVYVEGTRAREVAYDLGRVSLRQKCLVALDDRTLGRCMVELLSPPEYTAPGEYRCDLVLYRYELPAALPEKDCLGGRTLAPLPGRLIERAELRLGAIRKYAPLPPSSANRPSCIAQARSADWRDPPRRARLLW